MYWMMAAFAISSRWTNFCWKNVPFWNLLVLPRYLQNCVIVVCFFSNCCKGNTLLEPLGVKSWKAHCFQAVLGNYTTVANGWIIEINLNYIPKLESILSRPFPDVALGPWGLPRLQHWGFRVVATWLERLQKTEPIQPESWLRIRKLVVQGPSNCYF